MTILQVNLKHLYQRRGFWIISVIVALFAARVITLTPARNQQIYFFDLVPWLAIISLFIASLPTDVLTKPFSYCLPGHKKIPRKFLFSVGFTISFLWSLSFIFYPDLNLTKTILACLSAFSAFSIFYWFASWLVFNFRSWFFAVLPIALIILCNILLNINVFIDRIIAENPFPIILLGTIVNIIAWRYWGRSNLTRRYWGQFWMAAPDAWNKEKMFKLMQIKSAEKDKKNSNSTIPPSVENFFISRINQAQTSSLRQHIWATFYKTFSTMILQQRRELTIYSILTIPSLCLLCYLPKEINDVIFFMPTVMLFHISLWVHSSLLITNTRSQRFWSALNLAATTAIILTLTVTTLATIAQILAAVMPQLTIKGYEFVSNTPNINYFIAPLLTTPLIFTIWLIFHKKNMLAMFFTIIVFVFLYITHFTGGRGLTIMNQQIHITPLRIAIMIPLAWITFIATLRYICMRTSLIK